MNRYGEELPPRYYTQPDPDGLEMPLIKTPVYLTDKREIINFTYCTQEDARQACPQCESISPTIWATLDPGEDCLYVHWVCMKCNHRWSTHRGIFIQQKLF